MNFLAHAYLSFEDPDVLTGNMISDFVKGKKKFDYPLRVLKGIELHRAIDEFTDGHPVTREAAGFFRPVYGPYSLAFMDVVYDHFLALELVARGNDFLGRFVGSVYDKLTLREEILPQEFKRLLPYMKQENWLLNYQFSWGISKSFEGLVRRAKFLTESYPALVIFEENYEKLGEAYRNFFPGLVDFSLKKFTDIH